VIPRSPRWPIPAMLLLAVVLLGGACSRNSESSSTATPGPATPAAQATGDATRPVTMPADGTTPGAESSPIAGTATPVRPGTMGGMTVSIPDLHDNPDDYAGATVLTHGYVDEILSSNVVVLTDASEQLLILGAEGVLPEGLTADEFVQVSGRVEPFDPERAAEQLDIGLDGLDIARFDGESSLVVEEIRAGAVPVGEVVAGPASFQGRTIAVGGQIGTVIGARAFVLTPAGSGASNAELLVVTPFAAVPQEMADGARVHVVGEVAQLDDATVAGLGDAFAFLSDPAFDAYRDRPAFVSEVVEVVAPAPTASVEAILAQPDAWDGKTVTVIATVVERLTDRAVAVGPDGALMVVGTSDQFPASLTAGAIVVVNGTVQRFDPRDPPDVSGFDPEHPAVAAHGGQPIVVVSSVQVLPEE